MTIGRLSKKPATKRSSPAAKRRPGRPVLPRNDRQLSSDLILSDHEVRDIKQEESSAWDLMMHGFKCSGPDSLPLSTIEDDYGENDQSLGDLLGSCCSPNVTATASVIEGSVNNEEIDPWWPNINSESDHDLPKYYMKWSAGVCPKCCQPKLPNVRERHAEVNDQLESDIGNTRFKRWNLREKVFVASAVLERFVKFHSLSPSLEERNDARINNESKEHVVWRKIGRRVEIFAQRYYVLTGEQTTVRTVEAMQKQWKLSGGANISDSPESTENLLHMWDGGYNAGKLLSCPDSAFEQLVHKFSWQGPCPCETIDDKMDCKVE